MDTKIRYRDSRGEIVDALLRTIDTASLFEGAPIRVPASYHGQRHHPGEYWTATTRTHVLYESRLELLRLQLADFDPTVVAIAAQPFCLEYIDRDARPRKHIPDYLLRRRNGEVVVVNVKPPDWNRRPRAPHRPDFDAIDESLGSRGWGHELWTGVDLVVATNVRFLAGYRRSASVSADLVDRVVEAWQLGDTIGALESRLSRDYSKPAVRPALLHALWLQHLQTDLTVWIDHTSVLTNPTREG